MRKRIRYNWMFSLTGVHIRAETGNLGTTEAFRAPHPWIFRDSSTGLMWERVLDCERGQGQEPKKIWVHGERWRVLRI